MLSTFAVIRHQDKIHESATNQGSKIARKTRPFQGPQRRQSSSTSRHQESTVTTAIGNSLIPALSPHSSQGSAPRTRKGSNVITVLQDHGGTAQIHSNPHNIPSYMRMEPQMFYWMIASLLIMWGQGPAAFILNILCIDYSRLNDTWLTYLDAGGRTIFIRRELCVLSISILLMLLGCKTSAVVLFIMGTRPETFQKDWMA